ncbi:unnamed protein product [Urochloa humidicola]
MYMLIILYDLQTKKWILIFFPLYHMIMVLLDSQIQRHALNVRSDSQDDMSTLNPTSYGSHEGLLEV